MSIHMPTPEEIEDYERAEASRWTCACGYSSLADPCSGCGKPRPAVDVLDLSLTVREIETALGHVKALLRARAMATASTREAQADPSLVKRALATLEQLKTWSRPGAPLEDATDWEKGYLTAAREVAMILEGGEDQ